MGLGWSPSRRHKPHIGPDIELEISTVPGGEPGVADLIEFPAGDENGRPNREGDVSMLKYLVLFLGFCHFASAAESGVTPLIDADQSVKCFSAKECVHIALVQSRSLKRLGETNRISWAFYNPQIISVSKSTYLVALDYGGERRQLFAVELALKTSRFSMQMQVLPESTLKAVALD